MLNGSPSYKFDSLPRLRDAEMCFAVLWNATAYHAKCRRVNGASKYPRKIWTPRFVLKLLWWGNFRSTKIDFLKTFLTAVVREATSENHSLLCNFFGGNLDFNKVKKLKKVSSDECARSKMQGKGYYMLNYAPKLSIAFKMAVLFLHLRGNSRCYHNFFYFLSTADIKQEYCTFQAGPGLQEFPVLREKMASR